MARTFRQELETSLDKIVAMGADIRKVDFSKWPYFSDGVPNYHQLQDDPSYVAIRDIGGMVSLVLANLELVLSGAAQDKDPVKAFERFSDHMQDITKKAGYFTAGALSDGVLDTAMDVGLVTATEAEILRAKRPWHGQFAPADAADHVTELENTIRTICSRIDTECASKDS